MSAADSPVPGTPSLDAFMAQALAMEQEAALRYGELADAMETHNNREVAALFRKMAVIEGKHADQIMAAMGWSKAPALPPAAPWPDFEPPESIPGDEVHYLMQPYHALELALAAERRAESFFAHLAAVIEDETVRKAAVEFRDDEREHVALLEAWMRNVPKPDADWAHDPDPPRYDE
jgi:rubrerythrin